MTSNRDYLELTYKSINCFANDGKLDLAELQKLVDIALRDGVVDEDEKRVLNNIISRINTSELQGELLDKVNGLKTSVL